MASLYHKAASDVIWLRYRNAAGKWKGAPTRYRWSNIGQVRQARLLARRQSEIEAARGTQRGDHLSEWVLPWLLMTYEGRDTTTLDVYKRRWRTIQKFLALQKIVTAQQVTRAISEKYMAWRTIDASRNTAIADLKFLSMVMNEAKNREHVLTNPLARLGLKRERAEEKSIWSDTDIRTAASHLEREKSQWMLCAFYFGLYQACRLRQCQIPITSIRLDLGVIQYPDSMVKGLSGYAQPIDPRFRPILQRLMKSATGPTICTVPWDASIRLRRTLDRAGLSGLTHHGLRATWITRAAESGVPESQAMAFCHHSSREVHRVYKKLSSVGIAHVPALLNFPDLSSASGRGGSRRATADNAVESKHSRTPSRSRASGRNALFRASSEKTERARKQ